MSEWPEVTLGDLAEFSNGANFTKAWFGEGIKIIGVGDFGDRLSPDWDRIPEVDPGAVTSDRQRLEVNDLVFVRSNGNPALVGRSMLVTEGPLSTHSAFTIRARPDTTKVDPRFLGYQLRHAHKAGLMAAASGTNITNLNQTVLGLVPVLLPDMGLQRRIASVLGAIDDLIEYNRRRIALLEQMAQTIYREWFVHFRYPGHKDGELVDSPLGPVPTRFDVAPLSACCNINREQRRPEPDEEIVYIDISALGDRTVALPTPIPGSDAPGRARRLLSDGDIVWSMVRPGRRAHALLVKAQTNWIGSTGLAVISPHGVPPSFVFESVSTSTFSDYLAGKEQGAAYPAVRPIDFEQAQIVVPPEQVLRAFDDVVSPIHGLGWELAGQARAAAQLRDLLLPKLVTGAIDVSKLDLDGLLEESAA